MRGEELAPCCRPNDNFVDNLGGYIAEQSADAATKSKVERTSFEFGSHDGLSTERDVVSRAHGRIGGSDDGHAMRAIRRIELHDKAYINT